MTSVRAAGIAALATAACAGCGGGDGGGPDATPAGACTGSYSQEYPSADNPEFCMFPWDSTKPELGLTECDEVLENCSATGATPDFSCIDSPVAHPPTPTAVTLTGFVDVFSSGPDADGARIQIFRAGQLDGASDIDAIAPIAQADVALSAATLATARACPSERTLEGDARFGQGRCAQPDPDADCGGQCDRALDAVEFCHNATCDDLQRWEVQYAIADVPTNEFLVVRTVGLDADGNPQVRGNTWSPLVQYNVFLGTGDRACSPAADCEAGLVDAVCSDCIDTTVDPPVYRNDVNLLSAQDYVTIPTSAGLSGGVPPGHGGVAGEVHDCNGVRLRHAQVGFSADRMPEVIVFFNGNPVKTLPRLQQISDGTNLLGLYAGLDVAPGPMSVVAVGVRDGALFEVGRFRAHVWPDSVTLVRLGGGRPRQQP
ncbi:MAG: hypothetical protein D6689_21085 [Deltaproteobacteria bacterium]|nr:MAG: hypothetical protein D6689_21085 [Deltaproteobacteria bacterium]